MIDKHLRRLYKPLYRFIWNKKIQKSKEYLNSGLQLDALVPDKRNDYPEVENKIKHIGLRILRCLQELSVKHDFQFCLAYGTLLGAIRHDGFIPWDDDIDIYMTQEDLIKFIAVSKELPDHLKLFNMDVDFFKIMDRSSIVSLDGERGVAVDIFVLRNIGKDSLYFFNVHTLKKLIVPKTKYFPLSTHKFEKFEFPIPKESRFILEKLYGDFMSLPPIEKRVSHHSNIDDVIINNYGDYLN